jgi:hypothetical protein
VSTSRPRFPLCLFPKASTGFLLFICRHISERRTENPYTLCLTYIVFLLGPRITSRWANTWVPRVGKWTSIQGDIVGEYAFDGQQSLCVLVQNFTPAPSSSPTETTTEALTEPSGTSSVQSTPRYSDDYILHIVTYTLTNLILL